MNKIQQIDKIYCFQKPPVSLNIGENIIHQNKDGLWCKKSVITDIRQKYGILEYTTASGGAYLIEELKKEINASTMLC